MQKLRTGQVVRDYDFVLSLAAHQRLADEFPAAVVFVVKIRRHERISHVADAGKIRDAFSAVYFILSADMPPQGGHDDICAGQRYNRVVNAAHIGAYVFAVSIRQGGKVVPFVELVIAGADEDLGAGTLGKFTQYDLFGFFGGTYTVKQVTCNEQNIYFFGAYEHH